MFIGLFFCLIITVLKTSCELNTVNKSALWSERLDNEEMVLLLLRAGARVDIQNKCGATALIWTSSNGIEHILLAVGDGNTALTWAVNDCNPPLVKILLIAGSEPNIANTDGETPLIRVVRGDCFGDTIEMAHMLLDDGADPNCKDQLGQSALQYAVENENYDVVKLLLDAGADPNQLEARDVVLPRLIEANRTDILTIILEAGMELVETDDTINFFYSIGKFLYLFLNGKSQDLLQVLA